MKDYFARYTKKQGRMLNSKSDDEGKKNYLICIILRNGIAFMSNRVILKNFYMHRYFKTLSTTML